MTREERRQLENARNMQESLKLFFLVFVISGGLAILSLLF